MWQLFTERARRVVFFAQEEAGRLGENYVSAEHLLLALVREEGTVAARILPILGVPLVRVREEMGHHITQGPGYTAQDMQLTPRAKRVIDLAYDESKKLSNNYIGTEHLLLGLIREGEGLAARVLGKLGVDLERTRQAVRDLQNQERPPQAAEPEQGTAKVGDLGSLYGRRVVEVANDSAALRELAAIRNAKDNLGYLEMKAKGRFIPVPAGVQVRILQVPADMPPGGECLYIHILEGESIIGAGWIASDEFKPTPEPNEERFPPAV